MFCSPRTKNTYHGCFDKPALLRIITAYNQKYPNVIKINSISKLPDHKLWELVNHHMNELLNNQGFNNVKDKEWAWLDLDLFQHDKTLSSYYKPPKPKGQQDWLSTSDINNVLKQYEKIYPDFAFLGAVPMDFKEIIDEYKNLDLCAMVNGKSKSYYKRKITKLGFVFNTDPSYRPGQHWIAAFLDLTAEKPYVGFWDSYGKLPPPKPVEDLMNTLVKQAKKCLGIKLTKLYNSIRHQRKNYDCGVYCLYFIHNLLRGRSFEMITETLILDDDVNQYRNVLFRPTLHG